MSIIDGNLSSNLLETILNKCEDGAGEFVNQGNFGMGLKFSLSRSEVSPIKSFTLDNRPETGCERDGQIRTFFVKIVPISSRPSLKTLQQMVLTPRPIRIGYIYQSKERSGILNGDFLKRGRTSYVGITGGTEIPYKDILGCGWSIEGNFNKTIESAYTKEFLLECKTQVELYKKTNDNIDSCVPGVYTTSIVSKRNVHIIELMKRKFKDDDFGTMLFTTLSREIKHTRDITKKSQNIGLIVMPFMPIPPIQTGVTIFDNAALLGHIHRLGEYFLISEISDYNQFNYRIKDYTEQNFKHKRCLFYIVQIITNMLDFLELGWVHGDLHLNNILVNPKQITSTQCFTTDSNDQKRMDNNSPFIGKVFLIDYGGAARVSPIPSYVGMDEFQKFKEQIRIILETKGAIGFSPLEWVSYDWLVAIFVKRDQNLRYKITTTDRGTIVNEFIDDNLRKMSSLISDFRKARSDYQKMTLDTMSSSDPDFQSTIQKIRAMNANNNFGDVRGGRGVDIITRKIESIQSGIQSPHKSSKSKKTNMNEDLVKKIFAFNSATTASIGASMIENYNVGSESIRKMENEIITNEKLDENSPEINRSTRKRSVSKTNSRSSRSRSSRSRSSSSSRS